MDIGRTRTILAKRAEQYPLQDGLAFVVVRIPPSVARRPLTGGVLRIWPRDVSRGLRHNTPTKNGKLSGFSPLFFLEGLKVVRKKSTIKYKKCPPWEGPPAKAPSS